MRNRPGFSLVITLMLMILLTVIAVGLLTLSSVTLRAASQGEAMALAKANARLGLMLAIGEIQKELGPDQKITAVSNILNPADPGNATLKHPHLTGVWNSRQEDIAANPDYDRQKYFQRWLVSSPDPEVLRNVSFPQSGSFDNPVLMAGAHGTGNAGQAAYAGGLPVTAANPALRSDLAWWVADENCKGFTNPEDSRMRAQSPPAVHDLLAASGTPGAYGMQAIDPEYPANTPAAAKVLTHRQLTLALSPGSTPRDWFHDLSPYSRGLLTNVVKGGWRHDLNLYLEQPRPSDPWPNSPAPAKTGPNGKYALSEVNDYDILPWKALHHHYHLKERIAMNAGRPLLRAWRGTPGTTPDDLDNPRWNAGVHRPGPVLVRAVVFIAIGSIRNPANPAEYLLRFYTYPVVTLWNPYNVDLTVRASELNFLMVAFPMTHAISINGAFRETFDWVARGASGDNSGAGNQPLLNKDLTLQAGEARMLSPVKWEWNQPSGKLHLLYHMEDVPFVYSQSSPGGQWGDSSGMTDVIASKGAAADRVTISTTVRKWDQGGNAYLLDYPATFDIRGEHAIESAKWDTFQWSQKMGWLHESSTPAIASPDRISQTNKPSATFGEIFNAPRPFMAIDIQLKALDEAELPNKTWRDCIPSHAYQGVTKGLADATPYFSQQYKLQFKTLNSYQEASSYLQTAPDNPIHTYFGGSYFPSAGQSWVTGREIPLAPITSIAQLQHVPQTSCDNMYSSGFHFQNHAIGNSFASPGVPADKIKTGGWPFCLDGWTNSHGGTIDGKKYAMNQFHTRPNIDRSYAANFLLWDDYFFSSMAAQNDVLRSAGNRRTIDQVIREFFDAKAALPNERYQPWLGGKSAGDVTKRLLNGSAVVDNAYREVAAHLLVDGAFNINSTSAAAWKTMLAAAHHKNIVTMEVGARPADSGTHSHVVSRFSMPNGPAAKSGDANPSWQGYHELTETQLDELAEAIVRQVKLRGPFRSLAEFINRRLGPESDERTKYGALQAALEDPAVSINAKLRGAQITEADIATTSYQNKSAALGPRYQGSPPYVTQADLLNVMGPVLSARSDTFLVRGYGQARDASGKIVARAWCEAVVSRLPDYVEPLDTAETEPSKLKSSANKRFGRRFELFDFRWLHEHDI